MVLRSTLNEGTAPAETTCRNLNSVLELLLVLVVHIICIQAFGLQDSSAGEGGSATQQAKNNKAYSRLSLSDSREIECERTPFAASGRQTLVRTL